MKNEDIKKYYKIIVNELSQKADAIHEIEEAKEKNAEEFKSFYNSVKLFNHDLKPEDAKKQEELNAEAKRLDEAAEVFDIVQRININNLLYIQQELLNDAAEVLINSKYFNKPLGEKTKEKIQEELNEHIKSVFNIDVYTYVNLKIAYNFDDSIKSRTYEINIYYKDFYYQYELKQESIRIDADTLEKHLFYYSKQDFIKPDQTEKEARKILKEYKANYNKIQSLKKQIEEIEAENNQGKQAALKNYYIHYTIQQNY